MKQDTLIKTLQDIGLSENESRVYFASLSMGPATILSIARKAGIKRTTVYSVVESLKLRGIIHEESKGWKKQYVAEDPIRLEKLLERKQKKLTEALPDFSALYNLHESNSSIRYYEGIESVKGIFDMLIKDIKPHEEYLVIANQEKWYEQDQKFFQDFMERRAKLPIKIRMLLQDSPLAHEHKKFEKNYNAKIKILPSKTILYTDLVITPQHLMIQQLKLPIIAYVINNKSVIEMQKEFFEIMWDSLPE